MKKKEMERGAFRGYTKLPNSNSGGQILPDIPMGLPQLTHKPSNTNNGGCSSGTSSDDQNECTVREQDRFMPIANVIRIMRRILPSHAKISDDAKETIQECVSEYISFVTGEANERCRMEQRKTITAEDVLWAMSKLGFDDYIEPLTLFLHRYREVEGGERGSPASSSGGSSMVKCGGFLAGRFELGNYYGNQNGYLYGRSGGYFRKESNVGSANSATVASGGGTGSVGGSVHELNDHKQQQQQQQRK